jgi:DNA invertase Pin-like site-specific DNA recombinase
MARDGFGKLMDAVRAGEVTKVVVWRLDRLGRTARGLTELFEEFQALGVTLISLKEGVDLSTPAGRLICNVLASVAQFETEVRGERQRAGIEAAKAQGKKWGGGRNGYWRKLGPAKIAKILKLRSQGLTLKEVSAASEVSVISVRRVIQSQAG